jgi:pantoate--beta-alanine ligase
VISVTTISAARDAVAVARRSGRRIGFVPTMGYLHEGHLKLCDVAHEHADFVVVSVFVNPLQFGPGEDLDRYPRNIEQDTRLAEDRGVALMFVPDAREMYPRSSAAVRVNAPDLSDRLCGRFRPGHFEGVLTVVAKLFNIIAPDVAVFGQKDLQQSVLIRRMVGDLDFPLEIITAPIVREADGLALSSRNVYLNHDDRRSALSLSRALRAAQEQFATGSRDVSELVRTAQDVLASEPAARVQYVELVDVDTLQTPEEARAGNALAIAAFVGKTRLIDNHILS